MEFVPEYSPVSIRLPIIEVLRCELGSEDRCEMPRHDRHVRCYPCHGTSGPPDGRSQFVHWRHHTPTLLVGSDGSGVEIDDHERRSTRVDALEGVKSSTPGNDFFHDLFRDATRMLHGLILLIFGLVFQAQPDWTPGRRTRRSAGAHQERFIEDYCARSAASRVGPFLPKLPP